MCPMQGPRAHWNLHSLKRFTNSNILYEPQHGAREEKILRNTADLVYWQTKNMQNEKQTDLILVDFSKAFDKVAHEKSFESYIIMVLEVMF